ncbi:putative 2-dehydro-3-deoxygalactonokinase DgoK1 [Kordia antarctica]|uniref:Putative 2-dehydro-3-deoxygalactonokinase DgoK1 n=1 Tax=Kordia antarctica TaxID=1218801 RepID=A0A7L4ZRV2_9FLAO|nr:2-dehydro-3-deoxygalactonokinase [Kordia antarctica]QHI39227.1 putative 2-dehydro-3-deoxygalactonokinase DgoK1 [Kordia antarctica]
MKKTPTHFISCDWGTSNFRLHVVALDALKIIHTLATTKGVKVVYGEFLQQEKLSQTDFFAEYLQKQVQQLPKEHQNHLIIASGMITANIGMSEMPYAQMPFQKDGSSLLSKKITLNTGLEILLISGVSDAFGMMRGEETQAIGLSENMTNEDSILILPGTHSKHLTYTNGQFTALKSYMTGEVFELLATKSILSNSIKKTPINSSLEAHFLKGVQLGVKGELSANLFSIRANDLAKKATHEENYYFLSGLLIGDELAYLKETSQKIYIAAPASLSKLYQLGLDYIIGSDNYILFNEAIVEKAIIIGQQKIGI